MDATSTESPGPENDHHMSPTRERSHHASPEPDHDASTSCGPDQENFVDPRDEMSAFDWHDLEARYLEAMEAQHASEQKLLGEFNSLSEYFAMWAETGAAREMNRSHTRLRTQSAFVQKQENDLEERRRHYIQVVDAFRQALSLLNR